MPAFLLPAASSLAVLAVIASPSPPPREVELAKDFTLAVGRAARVRSSPVAVRFEAVTEDSRCPIDVTCVWEGNAAVRLEVSDGAKAESLALHSATPPRGSATFGAFVIRLVTLEPRPRSDRPIDAAAYEVTLRVERRPARP